MEKVCLCCSAFYSHKKVKMNSTKPYLGSKIALISNALNRYVGILYTIDKMNSTVVLAKVKCHGTEGRLTDRPTPPREDVYEYITFRGSDIKDISLCEPPPSQHGLPPDPAILLSSDATLPEVHSTLNLGAVKVPIYHQFPSQPLHCEDYATALGIGIPKKVQTEEKAVQTIGIERSRRVIPPSNELWEDSGPPARPPVRQPTRAQAEREPPHQRLPLTTRRGPRFPPARQNYNYRQNIENVPPRRQQGSWRGHARHTDAPLRFDTDFDFDFSNAQFVKHEDKQEPCDSPFEDDPFEPNRFYNKAKSFYDNIPSEKKIRLSWAEERQRNIETFGAPGRPLRSPGFRGGHSMGRGQRTGQGVFVF